MANNQDFPDDMSDASLPSLATDNSEGSVDLMLQYFKNIIRYVQAEFGVTFDPNCNYVQQSNELIVDFYKKTKELYDFEIEIRVGVPYDKSFRDQYLNEIFDSANEILKPREAFYFGYFLLKNTNLGPTMYEAFKLLNGIKEYPQATIKSMKTLRSQDNFVENEPYDGFCKIIRMNIDAAEKHPFSPISQNNRDKPLEIKAVEADDEEVNECFQEVIRIIHERILKTGEERNKVHKVFMTPDDNFPNKYDKPDNALKTYELLKERIIPIIGQLLKQDFIGIEPCKEVLVGMCKIVYEQNFERAKIEEQIPGFSQETFNVCTKYVVKEVVGWDVDIKTTDNDAFKHTKYSIKDMNADLTFVHHIKPNTIDSRFYSTPGVLHTRYYKPETNDDTEEESKEISGSTLICSNFIEYGEKKGVSFSLLYLLTKLIGSGLVKAASKLPAGALGKSKEVSFFSQILPMLMSHQIFGFDSNHFGNEYNAKLIQLHIHRFIVMFHKLVVDNIAFIVRDDSLSKCPIDPITRQPIIGNYDPNNPFFIPILKKICKTLSPDYKPKKAADAEMLADMLNKTVLSNCKNGKYDPQESFGSYCVAFYAKSVSSQVLGNLCQNFNTQVSEEFMEKATDPENVVNCIKSQLDNLVTRLYRDLVDATSNV